MGDVGLNTLVWSQSALVGICQRRVVTRGQDQCTRGGKPGLGGLIQQGWMFLCTECCVCSYRQICFRKGLGKTTIFPNLSDGQRHLVAQYRAGGDAVTLDRCSSLHCRKSNSILIPLLRTLLRWKKPPNYDSSHWKCVVSAAGQACNSRCGVECA